MPRSRTTSWRAYRPEAVAPDQPAPAPRCCVLGIDPGSQRTGYGLLACDGADYRYIAHGCIDVAGLDMAVRLRRIYEAISALVDEHRPDEVAIERVFVSRNPDSAIKLGQARGAALAAVGVRTVVHEYAPREIKLAIVGYGGAEKGQIGSMMMQLLALPRAPQADAADALAVAICHAHARRMRQLMQPRAREAR